MNFLEIFNTKPVSTHFLKRYLTFIRNCQAAEGVYTEDHHILPRSIFPFYRRTKENIVTLTARQHFIAHLILSKVFLDVEDRARMLKAFYRMSCVSNSTSHRKLTAYEYSLAKQANALAMELNNPMHNPVISSKVSKALQELYASEQGDFYREQARKRATGKSLSSAAKKKLSDHWKNKKRPKTPEHIENARKSISIGLFVTPFGTFHSPMQAQLSNGNTENLSRYLINKYCRQGKEGFSFKPKQADL